MAPDIRAQGTGHRPRELLRSDRVLQRGTHTYVRHGHAPGGQARGYSNSAR